MEYRYQPLSVHTPFNDVLVLVVGPILFLYSGLLGAVGVRRGEVSWQPAPCGGLGEIANAQASLEASQVGVVSATSANGANIICNGLQY